MIYRENGQFKTTYRADQQIFPILQDRIVDRRCCSPSPSSSCRSSRRDYLLRAILIPFLILSLAALGLNILVGYCGQISLGHRRLHGGRRVRGLQLHACASTGMPLVVALLLGGLCATVVGVLFGIPSAAHQGPLPRGGDARRAVLRRLGVPAHQVVHQRLALGLGQRRRPAGARLPDRDAGAASTCSAWPSLVRVRAAGQEPGARRHRPRVDGDPRHGRGRRGDRHPPGLRQAHGLRGQLASSSASPARCGASSTSARGSRRRSASTARSSCCSW